MLKGGNQVCKRLLSSGYGYITPDNVIERPVPTLYLLYKGHRLNDLSLGHGFIIGTWEDPTIKKTVVSGLGVNRHLQLGRSLNSTSTFQQTYIELDRSITKIVSGRAHSLALSTDGEVLVWGSNNFGQLGIRNNFTEITPLDFKEKVVDIAAGMDTSFVLTASGAVVSSGWAADGQTGTGSTETVRSFSEVKLPSPVRSISSSGDTTFVICNDECIYGWGNNEYNQLCPSKETLLASPILIDLPDISQIAAGGSFSLFLAKDGSIHSCGYGPGTGITSNEVIEELQKVNVPFKLSSISANLDHAAGITADRKLVRWGRGYHNKLMSATDDDIPQPTVFQELPVDVNKIVCGPCRTALLTQKQIKHLAHLGMIFDEDCEKE